jgi:hypothetical protein
MDNIFVSEKNKEHFYEEVKKFQEEEVNYLKKVNKNDHIKKIFSTLNFKNKGSSYTTDYGNYILNNK